MADRVVRSHLALLCDALPGDTVVESYRADEGVSLAYSVDVTLSTADSSFRAEDCLRRRMLLEVSDSQGGVRHYDGLPDRVGFVAFSAGRLLFRARLRPAMAALEHREGSRIFQGKSPVDVIKILLAEAGVDGDVEWRLRRVYAPREFLCQYRETEMSFVHRLLEDEGIFYFFAHSSAGHRLVFADDPGAFGASDGLSPVTLSPRPGGSPGTQPVLGLARRKAVRPTEILLRDYDFEKPDVFPTASVPAGGPRPICHYAYPAGFTESAEGSRKAERRLGALRADIDVCRGESRAAGLVAGSPMTIAGANEEALNGDFVVISLRSSGRKGEEACENEFTAIPKGAPFAPPRRTKRPRIRGVQTAVVTGAASEPQSIHVDRHGRVKVRFFWDRSGKRDDSSSCWVRVSQLPLGGSMVLPRVGWEVAVAFLDGDPDRPLVLGRAYDGEHRPPSALPGAAAGGSFKSMSTPGGAGHNSIEMGDSAGSQGLSISAQKDLNVSTGHDKTESVAVNEDHSVGSNYEQVVGSNETVVVGGNQSIDVGDALQVKVGAAQTIIVGGNEESHAKCDYIENVGATREYTVGGNQITLSNGVRQQITGAFVRDVGAVQASLSLASIDDTMLATHDEDVGLAIVQLVAGTSSENVVASKSLTSTAGELHKVSSLSTSANGVKQFIGGVHVRRIGGDFVVNAPTIVLGGAVGKLSAAGSSVKLNGGPITLSGSKIAIHADGIVKTAGDLKIG